MRDRHLHDENDLKMISYGELWRLERCAAALKSYIARCEGCRCEQCKEAIEAVRDLDGDPQ